MIYISRISSDVPPIHLITDPDLMSHAAWITSHTQNVLRKTLIHTPHSRSPTRLPTAIPILPNSTLSCAALSSPRQLGRNIFSLDRAGTPSQKPGTSWLDPTAPKAESAATLYHDRTAVNGPCFESVRVFRGVSENMRAWVSAAYQSLVHGGHWV